MWKKRNILRLIISGGVLTVALIVGNLCWPMLPQLANHFGFALPGLKGLPYRVVYAGRAYSNTSTCAYADWCQSPSQDFSPDPLCQKKEDIQRQGDWPLAQVGIVFTFIGLPYPLMMPQVDVSRKLSFGVYIGYSSDCYVPYTLEGGP